MGACWLFDGFRTVSLRDQPLGDPGIWDLQGKNARIFEKSSQKREINTSIFAIYIIY